MQTSVLNINIKYMLFLFVWLLLEEHFTLLRVSVLWILHLSSKTQYVKRQDRINNTDCAHSANSV